MTYFVSPARKTNTILAWEHGDMTGRAVPSYSCETAADHPRRPLRASCLLLLLLTLCLVQGRSAQLSVVSTVTSAAAAAMFPSNCYYQTIVRAVATTKAEAMGISNFKTLIM